MHCIKHIVGPFRLVAILSGPVQCSVSSSFILKQFNVTSLAETQATAMSQRSITSFFTKTPKKSDEDPTSKKSKTPGNNKSSPATNGNSKRESTKRPRIASSSSEDQSPKKVAPSSGESPVEEKISKRPRLLSSESDSKSPVKPPSSEKKKTNRQRIESSSSDSAPESPINTKIKEEKPTPVKTYASPKTKKKQTSITKTPVEKKAKQEKIVKPKEEKKSPLVERNVKVEKETKKESDTNGKSSKDDKKDGERVAEADYNPNKSKYEPILDACWARGEPVPYLALARTLEAIEGTSARLKMIEILSNYFRSVLVLTPEDLLPSVYLCLNQLAPAYHSIELGIAETYLMKAIGQSTGRTLAQMKASAAKSGDLGIVAEEARAAQRVMFPAPPLVLRKVFAALREIANMTGQSSVNKKISKIQSLYVACRYSEARYLIRSLAGKLRIGLAEQSVLQALAQCATATPPPQPYPPPVLDASRGLTAEEFKAKIEENALIIKSTYCECPNYDEIIPVLAARGVAALPAHCRLAPGVPLKPMLAHPTKGVSEVFDRFEGLEFTCEYKYDGERAQIHVPTLPDAEQADVSNASIFSRNQENNTSKYPDILRRLPALMKDSVRSCVLDCEAVAYDVEKKQILPFQILSTRKRKDASESDIKVQVCVFVFDLLYLNGRALVREPLRARRALLREHFNEVEGEWQFATSADCSTMEEVQQFLEESVKASCEGLMVKTLAGKDATYEIARRSRNWLKLKKDYLDGVGDTIDAVVIGAYCGKGKRAGLYGTFLLACYDPDSEEFQSLCKIGTGFSDEQLREWSQALRPHAIEQPRSYYRYDSSHSPDAWFATAKVMEVRCADLSLSPAHRAAAGRVEPDKGVSLRFPRFVRVRDDKTPEQATSAQQIAEMYLAQDQVKNTGAKAKTEDDFY